MQPAVSTIAAAVRASIKCFKPVWPKRVNIGLHSLAIRCLSSVVRYYKITRACDTFFLSLFHLQLNEPLWEEAEAF